MSSPVDGFAFFVPFCVLFSIGAGSSLSTSGVATTAADVEDNFAAAAPFAFVRFGFVLFLIPEKSLKWNQCSWANGARGKFKCAMTPKNAASKSRLTSNSNSSLPLNEAIATQHPAPRRSSSCKRHAFDPTFSHFLTTGTCCAEAMCAKTIIRPAVGSCLSPSTTSLTHSESDK